MILTPYQESAAFAQATQAVLGADEAANNLLIGLIRRWQDDPSRFKSRPYAVTISDDQGVAVVGMMTPPWPLIAYSNRLDDNSALHLLVSDLQTNGWVVPGVTGPVTASQQTAEIWAETTGQRYEIKMHQRIYELRRVTVPQGVSGQMRFVTEADFALVANWIDRFSQDALAETNRAEAEKSAARIIQEQSLCLWIDKGQPVSMAARTRSTPTGICVSYVYTPPQFRRRGYATACVAALSQHLLDIGYQFCCLFTDLANSTSNAIYQQIGYKPVCDFNVYQFR